VDPEVTMPEFASELLRTLVRKKPEQVWEVLTATGIPLGYLYGMTVESDWRPGTSVTMTLGDQARLTGDVLVAERPGRLSYTLGDRPGQPSVYVNWELRALGDATIVRLYVDEPWPDADPTDDLEAAWLPVLYDLVAYLDWGAGRFPSDRDLPDPSGLRFATVPDPAGRGAPPMSTGTITARPAAGAGPAGAPRTAFVLADGAALGAMQAVMVCALHERGITPGPAGRHLGRSPERRVPRLPPADGGHRRRTGGHLARAAAQRHPPARPAPGRGLRTIRSRISAKP
jgi:hypothetical protein